jgi:hypothetical protein
MSGMRDPEDRVDQPCHGCGIFDQHPRHHVLGRSTSQSTWERVMHMDCCRDAGCPDGSCGRILSASGEKRGDELIAYVRQLAPGQHVTPGEVVVS